MQDERFPKNIEKRHYHRLDLQLPVELHVDGEKVQATTGNVSCGGMFLPEVKTKFDKESDILAYIHLPNRSQAVRLPAKVIRMEYTELNPIDASSSVALEFDGLYDDNRLAIDSFIKWKLLN